MQYLIRCAALVFLMGITAVAYSTPAWDQSDTSVGSVERLRRAMDSLFGDPKFSNATFGVAIQSLKTGEYLYRKNETKSLMPASNMKLFTTAEALALLGPEYRYRTPFLTNLSEVEGHSMQGLLIEGSCDPTFCSSTMYGDSSRFDSLKKIVRQIRSSGIDSIHGSIWCANNVSEDLYPAGWEIEDIGEDYALEVHALNFDENQVAITISPSDTIGNKARVGFGDAGFGFISVQNSTVTTARDSSATSISVSRELHHNIVDVDGSFSHYSRPIVKHVSVMDAADYAAKGIASIFKQGGIAFDTSVARSAWARSWEDGELGVYTSPLLSEIVRAMNKESDNLYAECVFRTVARVTEKTEDWSDDIEVMRKYLATIGIDTTRLQFTDGSGLSRMDLVTADDIVTLLRAMSSNPKLDSAFYNSLPIMGVDGTLENQMKGTPTQGNVHAKTGSMTGVRAISGYLTTSDGEPIAFSILANNYTVPGSEIGKLEDEVLLRLVNFSRK
ncbi:MAG TPA: D-alanyl-D-alanine carboxypeptidase/D-alanyl-D-alanine-endopeptidase [Candidatus Kapabacteria bacterium]|nr:D-alanyl-D-alanine carboxypeptidase/D-alanyl-D-alanine-endopeptidase [Candidatus Kapabacteria bacterium]